MFSGISCSTGRHSTKVKLGATWLLTIFTLISILSTVIFAYNSRLFVSAPSRAVAVLNVLSHFTVFLLQTLTSSVFDELRWGFASRNEGVSAFSFLVLSPATSIFGVLEVWIRTILKSHGGPAGHHFWGFQR